MKATAIICLILGYWLGNLVTSNRVNQDAQKKIDSLSRDRKAYFQQIQACEQRYIMLKNGDIAKAEKMEKELDNNSGW